MVGFLVRHCSLALYLQHCRQGFQEPDGHGGRAGIYQHSGHQAEGAAGLPFLKNLNPPAGSKTVEQLGEIVNAAGIPFIVKGIMTVSGAKKAFDAGASAIVVSNHGGRVLDQTPATAEVLERIVEWNQGRMKIFVDGGIRQGTDIFKALAMGADAVLIARPFVQAVYGGAEEGVKLYIEKLAAELSDTMAMCGAASIKDINRSMLYRPM